ncbi:MAG: hypothetical protein IT366_23920 [Candidatus Hydrogenedentes bacterium]|nr:hypothetical protein [Candidatus Hydrogenedentota bacterium]
MHRNVPPLLVSSNLTICTPLMLAALPFALVAASADTAEKITADALADENEQQGLRLNYPFGLDDEPFGAAFAGTHSLTLGGFALFDWGNINQDKSLDALVYNRGSDAELSDLKVELRGRAIGDFWFKLQLDIEDGELEIQDNYLVRNGVPYLGSFQLGHFKEPFGLENLGPIRHSLFMERSLVRELTPGRSIGVSASNTAFGERLTWTAGAFYETHTLDAIGDSSAFAITGRVTALPLYREENKELLQVGLSASHRTLYTPARFEPRPETSLYAAYLDTGEFSAKTLDLFGLEAAYMQGPLYLQGEYIWGQTSGAVRATDLTLDDLADYATTYAPRFIAYLLGRNDRAWPDENPLWEIPFDLAARDDVFLFGTYAQVGYVLTGESRKYDKSKGMIGPVVPNNPIRRGSRGTGAWEIGLRISHIDLNDEFVRGGRETNLTVGLNWYLNENTRVMWNYIHGLVNRADYEGEFDAVQMRFQVEFAAKPLTHR